MFKPTKQDSIPEKVISMSWESKFENLKPVIEEYINQNTSSFTSRDIADLDDKLEPDDVGKTLKFADVHSVLKTGNNPATWEALYAEEDGEKYIFEPEVYEEPEEEDEDPVERALETLNTDSIGQIYSYFRNRLNISSDSKISDYISEYRERRN